MKAPAESVLDQRRVPTIGISAGKAALPFDDVVGPAVTLCREQRRGDAALGGVGRVDALGRSPGIVELREAAGVAAGQAQRVGDLPRRILAAKQQPSGRRRGAEPDAGAGALKAALEMTGLHGKTDADRYLITRDDRCQHLRPRRAGVLGDRERR